MDLTPLYELRERMKIGAIAGTGLICEDFRLLRSIDALSPLEADSPIIKKLLQAARVILSPDCKNRGAALMDALALCDAILITQGNSEVNDEIIPLPNLNRGAEIIPIPYSILSNLHKALTTSVAGKYNFILEMHKEHPEYFRDFRVRFDLVDALGSNYPELAEKVEEWLSQEGEDILPLLQIDFEEDGNKEMVRRIHIMEAVADENDYFLSLLDMAKGNVKAALIYALRHEESNAERLVELANTQKGSSRKKAHWALAEFKSQVAWDYFHKLAQKKPEQAAEFMSASRSEEACNLLAEILNAQFDLFEEKKEEMPGEFRDLLQKMLYAMVGKSNDVICNFYRRAACYKDSLNKIEVGKKGFLSLQHTPGTYSARYYSFQEIMPAILLQSVVQNPTKNLTALSEELFEKYGPAYAAPYIMAGLLKENKKTAYERAKMFLKPPLHIFGKKKEQKAIQETLSSVLEGIYWDKEENCQKIKMTFYDFVEEQNYVQTQRLAESLDLGWYEVISANEKNEYQMLQLIQLDNLEVRKFLMKYYLMVAEKTTDNYWFVAALKDLGYEEYKGMLFSYCMRKNKIQMWDLRNFVDLLPLSGMEKAAELEQFLTKIKKSTEKVQNEDNIRLLIDELKMNVCD